MIVILWILEFIALLWEASYIVGTFAGIVMIVKGISSYRKCKAKDQPLLRSAVIIGIGIFLAGVTIPMSVTILTSNVETYIYRQEQEKQKKLEQEKLNRIYQERRDYYNPYIETGIKAEYGDSEAEFTVGSDKYIIVNYMELKYHDKLRGDIAANIGEKTVFEYNHASGCRMMCISESIYCHTDDREKLADYYTDNNNGSYECIMLSFREDDITVDNTPDEEMFDRLFELEFSQDDVTDVFDEDRTRIWNGCRIKRTSIDDNFERRLRISVYGDNVYVTYRTCDFGEERWGSSKYLVSDSELRDYWYDFVLKGYDGASVTVE